MKSQSQLQQDAVAAAILKKAAAHGNATNGRRLRRNVDVVVNALASKNRSHSSNLIQPVSSNQQQQQHNQSMGQIISQHQQQQQQPYNQYNHPASRKQQVTGSSITGGSTHSHSQQVLDSSQAIQAKISMYTNQAQAKKQQIQQSTSPIGNTSGVTKKNSSSKSGGKIVPAQLSRAFLAQRQNQTPTPNIQQQNLPGPAGGNNPTYFNQNIQQQLSNLVSKRATDRNIANQNLLTAYNSNNQGMLANAGNLSSYYDIGLTGQHAQPPQKLPNHSNSSHNLVDQRQRAASQLSGHSSGKQNVQMKGSKTNRSNQMNGAYPSTLSNRQKSSKQFNQSNTLYSQISLKEIQSPVKLLKMAQKVNTQRMTGMNFYGHQHSGKQKGIPGGASGYHQNSATAQAFEQYGSQQQQPTEIADLKDIQNMMENMGQPEDHQHSQQQLVRDGSTQRSRNIQNLITTNGVTSHSQGSQGQGAILNINTASDINIYNNSFIVQTSPGHTQTTTQQATSQPGLRQPSVKRVTSTTKPSRGGKANPNTGRNLIHQTANGSGGSGPTQNQLGNAPRSISTGRNQKSSQGTRNGTNKAIAKTQRAQAVNDAYSQNRNYVINNQILQTPPVGQHLMGQQPQLLPQPQLVNNNWAVGQNVYQQQPKKSLKQGGGPGKSYNSTENIKRSDDSQLGFATSEDQARNSSLNKPQFNNLVNDSQKRLAFAQESGLAVGGSKRNFKNVKRNRDAFNTQQVPDIRSTSTTDVAKNTKFVRQKSAIIDRSVDLISRGRAKIKAKEYAEAVKLFSEVLEQIDSKNITAIFYRGVAYLDQGNLQQAISELWRVVDQKEEDNRNAVGVTTTQAAAETFELCQQAYILLSIAHKRLGENKNAIVDLQMCIEAYPKYAQAFLARGQAYLLQEDFKVALGDFKTYLKLNKDAFSGHLGVGDCYKALKNYEAATQAYREAIKLLPLQKGKANFEQLFLQCYMKRGLSGYHEGNHKQALSDLQTVIQKDTQNVKAHFYIGKLLAKGVENEHSKAIDAVLHFEQVAKYPDQEFYSGNALFQIAKLRLRQKDYYEAFYCLKRAADNNFTSKRLSMFKDFTEGVLYLIKRKIKKGVQILSDLLEILINKDKDEKSKEKGGSGEEGANGKDKTTIDWKKRQADKMHSDYLIHQILIYRAYGYVAIEKYEMAQEDIRRVGQYGKVDNASIYNKWLGKGILRMDHEDYLMASKFFSKAWKKYPANKDPYCLQVISIVRSYSYSMGGYFIDQQVKYDKVMETKKFMDKAITNCCSKDQKEPCLYFFRGLLYFQMHHFYEALADFNKAIEIEEESSAHFFLARGRTYACLSILTEAMKDLSVALNLDETLQQAYIYRGKCAYLIGDNNLAFLDFQRLILTDPKNPMVHVYAGNLLMTTGAYQDAIKAYENADTVQPTTVSSFQRVRCFCALSDLENAKILLDNTQKVQPDDVMLKFDGICLDELIRVSQVSETINRASLTPANVKNTDKTLKEAISTFDELVVTYQSSKLQQLKRRDSILNIQVIPNVERIKIEKAMVAKDFNSQKEQLPLEQRADFPSLTIDFEDQPMQNIQNRKRLKPYSYYYENIFNIEDFLLYRGIFKFFSQRYVEAVADFEQAMLAHQEQSDKDGTIDAASNPKESRFNALNTKNPTLQHFTMKSGEQTLQSNVTDLSDIGLSSFHEVEITYNILMSYIFANDQSNALNKLNELQRKTPRKYSKLIPLLRIITLDHFGQAEKVTTEVKQLKKMDSGLYDKVFGSGKGKPFIFEMFPSDGRLCTKFAPTNLRLGTKSKQSPLAGVVIQIRLSFSMPFIKPPNMIPNVDEDSIQSEFNLKQIDAPMPEAPWIKRCGHGINFTNQITKEDTADQQDKFKKFFEEKKTVKSISKADSNYPTTEARLLSNMVGETVSDRHKISLAEDSSRIYNEEDDCKEAPCAAINVNGSNELNETVQQKQGDPATEDYCSEMPPLDSDESYDSEDLAEKGQSGAMAIRASQNLIVGERDSLVNMGENVNKNNIREIKKMRQEIVEPNLGQGPSQLLNKVEETKNGQVAKRTLDRYADFEEDLEAEYGVGSGQRLPETESQIQSARHRSSKLLASQQLAQATQAEPHSLNEKMLAGNASGSKRMRERRVSNLSLNLTQTPNQMGSGEQQKEGSAAGEQQRRSLFRTSIDNDSM